MLKNLYKQFDKSEKNKKINYINELNLNLDLNFYDEEEKDKLLDELDEQLFKGVKPEKDKLRVIFIYLEILNILVDMPSFNALKIEKEQIDQNFHIFFFFLISCKYELARYVYEQTKV